MGGTRRRPEALVGTVSPGRRRSPAGTAGGAAQRPFIVASGTPGLQLGPPGVSVHWTWRAVPEQALGRWNVGSLEGGGAGLEEGVTPGTGTLERRRGRAAPGAVVASFTVQEGGRNWRACGPVTATDTRPWEKRGARREPPGRAHEPRSWGPTSARERVAGGGRGPAAESRNRADGGVGVGGSDGSDADSAPTPRPPGLPHARPDQQRGAPDPRRRERVATTCGRGPGNVHKHARLSAEAPKRRVL